MFRPVSAAVIRCRGPPDGCVSKPRTHQPTSHTSGEGGSPWIQRVNHSGTFVNSSKQKKRFDEAAQLPFADDDKNDINNDSDQEKSNHE